MEAAQAEATAQSGSRRRLALVSVDQLVSAGSNFAATLAAAHVLAPTDFGYFALIFICYTMVLVLSRSGVSEPLLAIKSDGADDHQEAVIAAGLVGLGGAAVFAVVVVVGALTHQTWALGGAVLAIALPFLTMQDAGRYRAISLHLPRRALNLDLAWLGLSAAFIAVLIAVGSTSLTWFVAAWAGGGALTGLWAWWSSARPRPAGGLGWIKANWGFSWRYLIGYLSSQGAVLLASLVMIALVGAAGLGSVRAALILYGPVAQLQVAVLSSAVAEIARLRPRDAAVPRHVARSIAVTTVAALLTLVVLVLLPDSIGRLLLGKSWTLAKTVIVGAGVQKVLLGVGEGPRAAVLGFRRVDWAVKLDVAGTVLLLAGAAIGAAIHGIPGAVWGQVILYVPVVVGYWIVYLRLRRADVRDPVLVEL